MIKKFITSHCRAHLQGGALIILLTILVLGSAALLLNGVDRRNEFKSNNQRQTIAALAQAKEALLGYAISHYDQEDNAGWYGFLPCPDLANNINPEGSASPSCGNRYESQLGRLPWRTLGIPPVYDGAGECLWYAVTGDYKVTSDSGARAEMLNEDTNGWFEIMVSKTTGSYSSITGSEPENRVVAVVIAPGEILPGQDREGDVELCGGNYDAKNYLDSAYGINNWQIQADDDSNLTDKNYSLVTALDNLSAVNDRIVYITKQELFGLVRNRTDFIEKMQQLTKTLASCLADYALLTTDSQLPWPAPVDLKPGNSVGKSTKKIYSEDALYDDQTGLLVGRFPNEIDDSNLKLGKTEQLITDCQFFDKENLRLWQHWKDHFFYALAEARQPDDINPVEACNDDNCLKVEDDPDDKFYVAIVLYAGSALSSENQQRNPENKAEPSNYLEGKNLINFTKGGGYNNNIYQQWNIDNINDILYCIDENLTVTYCPPLP